MTANKATTHGTSHMRAHLVLFFPFACILVNTPFMVLFFLWLEYIFSWSTVSLPFHGAITNWFLERRLIFAFMVEVWELPYKVNNGLVSSTSCLGIWIVIWWPFDKPRFLEGWFITVKWPLTLIDLLWVVIRETRASRTNILLLLLSTLVHISRDCDSHLGSMQHHSNQKTKNYSWSWRSTCLTNLN